VVIHRVAGPRGDELERKTPTVSLGVPHGWPQRSGGQAPEADALSTELQARDRKPAHAQIERKLMRTARSPPTGVGPAGRIIPVKRSTTLAQRKTRLHRRLNGARSMDIAITRPFGTLASVQPPGSCAPCGWRSNRRRRLPRHASWSPPRTPPTAKVPGTLPSRESCPAGCWRLDETQPDRVGRDLDPASRPKFALDHRDVE
jgi:hypothetical protein